MQTNYYCNIIELKLKLSLIKEFIHKCTAHTHTGESTSVRRTSNMHISKLMQFPFPFPIMDANALSPFGWRLLISCRPNYYYCSAKCILMSNDCCCCCCCCCGCGCCCYYVNWVSMCALSLMNHSTDATLHADSSWGKFEAPLPTITIITMITMAKWKQQQHWRMTMMSTMQTQLNYK